MSKKLFLIVLSLMLLVGYAVPAPAAYAIGNSSKIEIKADPDNKDKIKFVVKNNEDAKMMDFHIEVRGAKINKNSSIGSPNGWASKREFRGFECYEVTWEATSTAAAIQSGNSSDKFSIEISDNDNKHAIRAWVTYEKSGGPGDKNDGYSWMKFSQKRANKNSSWETEKAVSLSYYKDSIGPGGGSLAVGSDGTIVVSAGAVTADYWFGGCVLPSYTPDYIGKETSDGGHIMKSFALGPDGVDFASPATLKLSYASIPGISNPRPYLYDPETETWSLVPGASVDLENQLVIFDAAHFSIYGIGGDPRPVPATSNWSILALGISGLAVLYWRKRQQMIA